MNFYVKKKKKAPILIFLTFHLTKIKSQQKNLERQIWQLTLLFKHKTPLSGWGFGLLKNQDVHFLFFI